MSEAVRGRMRDRIVLVDGRSLLSLMNLMAARVRKARRASPIRNFVVGPPGCLTFCKEQMNIKFNYLGNEKELA
jgi:hypothetical protein